MVSAGTELRRKAVHVGVGFFALALRWLTPWQAVACAVAALAFNLLVLHRLTRCSLLRESERGKGFSLGIALYPAMVLALLLVFRARLELAAAAWALLAFGDGMAAVTGVTLRGPALPWNRDKTWAGLTAFVLYGTVGSAFLIRWVQAGMVGGHGRPWVGASFLVAGPNDPLSATALLVVGCFVAALAASLAESARTGVDDNLLVPLVGGAVLYAATLVEPWLLRAGAETLVRQGWQGAVINGVLAVLALWARGVGLSGAIWGFVLGTILYAFGGWPAFLMLLLFFVLGTAATRLGYARKATMGVAQEREGRRGARNAFANTGAGVLFAFLAAATPYGNLFLLAAAAAFATAAADTVSSEIGQAFGRRTFLITTFRGVPPGTDGAVSLEGTLAGVLAAVVLGAAAWATGMVSTLGAGIIVIAAFAGATLESYAGALCVEKTKAVDNELVNFANTVAGGAVAIALGVLLL